MGSRPTLRYGLYALLAFAPLPFGSVQPWAVLTIEVAAATLGVIALVAVRRDPSLLSPRARRMIVPVAALVGIGLLQLAPLGDAFIERRGLEARRSVASVLPEASSSTSRPSLDPSETTDALLRLVAYACVGVAAAVAVRSAAELRSASLWIAGIATFQSLYGMAEYLSGHQHIFSYAKRYYVEEATGTFINRNHFASFLAMSLPFALALALQPHASTGRRSSWREEILRRFGKGSALARPFAIGAAGAIWAGVLLSFSRGGLVAALLSALVVSYGTMRRRTAWLLISLFLVPLLWLSWKEIRAPGERLVDLGSDLQVEGGRLAVWRATSQVIPGYALLGSGFGTFEEVFATLQPAGMDRRYDHAHNDWLQVLLEGGVLALLACGAMLVLTLAGGRGRRGDPALSLLTGAPIAGIVAIAFHSMIDFSLRIPADAVLFAVLLGIAASRDEIALDPALPRFPSGKVP